MMKGWKTVAFSILHIMGAAGIPVLLALTLGCIKKEEGGESLGPEVSASLISAAMEQANEDRNLLDAQKDDWVLYDITLQAFTGPLIAGGAKAQSIVNRKDLGDSIELTIRTIEYNDDGSVDSDSAETCEISKIDGYDKCNTASSISSKGAIKGNMVAAAKEVLANSTQYIYYNFTWTVGEKQPSQLIQNQPNCGGVPNCRFRVNHLEYDVIAVSGNVRTQQHYAWDLSADAPYLGMPINLCVKQLQTFQGKVVPVTQCMNLINLRYGVKKISSEQEISEAIANAVGKNLYSSPQGETAASLTATRIGQGEYNFTQALTGILEKTPGTNNATLKIGRNHYTKEGDFVSSESEDCVVQSSGEHNCSFPTLPFAALKSEPDTKTNFYNFTKVNFKDEAPESIRKAKPECAELPPDKKCPIDATMIRFEKHEVKGAIERRSVHYIEVSPEAPALDPIVFSCSRGFSPIGGLTLTSRVCHLLN